MPNENDRKERRVDLHMHTTHSDGTLTPAELVQRAAGRGLFCIALTDHDTVSGVCEAQTAGSSCGVEVIAGIEISAVFQPGTMHLLGYFLDIESENLKKALDTIQQARRERNPMIVEKLNQMNMPITLEEVAAVSGGEQIGRPHFARVLVQKGYVKDFEEAFNKYLAKGRPAYVDKRKLSSEEAFRMIHDAGGVSSLAHPKQLRLSDPRAFESEVSKLVDQGLDGIEVYSSCQSADEARYYRGVSQRFGLTVTGGSDFHGANKSNIDLGWMGDGASLTYDTIDELRHRRPKRNREE